MEDSHSGHRGPIAQPNVAEQPWDHVNATAQIQLRQMAGKTALDLDFN